MLFQPRLYLALGLNVFLQLFQCRQTRFELRIVCCFGIDLLLCAAALFFQSGLLFLRVFELRLRLLQRSLLFLQLHLQIGQMRRIWQVQAILFLRQPFAARRKVGQNVRGIALMRGFEFDLLLHLHRLAAGFRCLQLCLAPRLVQCRQPVILLLRRLLRLLDAHHEFFEMHLGLRELFLLLLPLTFPLIALCLEGIELRLQTIARLDHELDLRFQTANFGIGLVQVPLRLMHAIAGGIMRLAHVFEFGLDVTQLCSVFFEIDLRAFDIAKKLVLFRFRFVLAQQPQQLLLFFLVRLQFAEFLRHCRLRLQLFQIRIQFAQDIFQTCQVLARVMQAVFSFSTTFLVFRHSCGFFKENA